MSEGLSALEPIENSYSLEELRREYRYFVDNFYALLHALRDQPELPPPFVLLHLGTIGKWPADYEAGKKVQQERGLDAVPPKTECEIGAGVWTRLMLAAPQAPGA